MILSNTALYTVDEVAARMSVNRMTVYRRIATGELPAVDIGRKGGRARLRVTHRAFEEFVASRKLPVLGRGAAARACES